jgi:hypothetical protein
MKAVFNITIILFMLVACRKQDDYKKFLEGGEILYTGKADSMRVHAGRKRAQVSWLLISDPKITKSKLYWNNRKDSAIIPIERGSGVDTIRYVVEGLEERTYEFEVFNYDHSGNVSVRSHASGVVYGDLYETSLLNRAIASADMEGTSAVIKWGDIDSTGGILGMQLLYMDAGGTAHDTLIYRIPEKQVTILPNYRFASEFSYRTLYLPDSIAIDTFYAAYQSVKVKGGEISFMLKNTGAPFLKDPNLPSDGRWGHLKDWMRNVEASKNATYDQLNGESKGYMTLWIWDNGPLHNAKLYQTIQLPAGEFRFECTVQNIDGPLENTYLTVASGSMLPDVENIQAALGSSRLQSNSQKQHSVPFTLQAPGTVTLGLVGTFVNPAQQGVRIERVKLFQDK